MSKRLIIAKKAAREVGKLLMADFNGPLKIKRKKDGSFVSNADMAAEKIVINLIRKNFPHDGILSEEGDNCTSSSGYEWIIDPLDGTHNYIRGSEIFGTSIGVKYKDEMVVGVILMPYTRELYAGEKGSGAYKNGKKIHVSKTTLEKSTIIYDSTIQKQKKKMTKALEKLASKVFNLRMFGSTVRGLSYVAEGKAEAEVEFNDKIWDFAAGILLVEEAGGHFSDFNGRKTLKKQQPFIVSNKVIYPALLKMSRRFL